jgi:hypothetical protein
LNLILRGRLSLAGGDQSQRDTAFGRSLDDKADTLGAGLFFFLFPFAATLPERC